MRVFALLFIAFLAFLPQSIIAQTNAATATPATTNNDPIAEYAAYNHAIAAGDIDTAARHAMAAWRGAETAWGAGNVNTGALAYNAAWSALLNGAISSSIEPARRAIELARPSGGAYTPEEAKFLLAFGEFSLATPAQRNRQVRAFIGAIEKVENSWEDQLIVDALNLAVSSMIANREIQDALASANTAIARIAALGTEDKSSRSIAFLNRGIANIMSRNYQDATSDLIEARLAYGRPRNRDDVTWGQLAAWHEAADYLAQQKVRSANRRGSPQPSSQIQPNRTVRILTPQEAAAVEYSATCRGITLSREENIGQDFVVPQTIWRNGLVVSIFVRLSIGADGRVTDAKVLGSVPNDVVSRSAEAALSTWKFTMNESTPTECLQNYLYSDAFSLITELIIED